MIEQSQIIPDPCDDPIGRDIRAFQAIGTWTKQKYEALRQLMGTMKRAKYYTGGGRYSDYQLTKIGTCFRYDVPATKLGHLRRFRGKRVRLVCVGSKGASRIFMVGVVGPTRPNREGHSSS